MNTLQAWIDRVFRFEIIDGHGAVALYLHRWRLLSLGGGRAVYLHHFLGSDWSRDLHDHPKPFVSIGLRGGYVEETFNPVQLVTKRRQWRAPWIRRFPAWHVHRLRITRARPTWTLVYVGKAVRDWGFWTPAGWVEWSVYVRQFGGRR